MRCTVTRAGNKNQHWPSSNRQIGAAYRSLRERRPAWDSYYRWVEAWRNSGLRFRDHPGCDRRFRGRERSSSHRVALFRRLPVYHLHESLDRLLRLVKSYPRIALGSSGEYCSICTLPWWVRMADIMTLLCDEPKSEPTTRLHGLRMLVPAIIEHIPLS